MTILSRGKENFCLEIGRRRNRQILWRRNIFGMVSRRGKKMRTMFRQTRKWEYFGIFFLERSAKLNLET